MVKPGTQRPASVVAMTEEQLIPGVIQEAAPVSAVSGMSIIAQMELKIAMKKEQILEEPVAVI